MMHSIAGTLKNMGAMTNPEQNAGVDVNVMPMEAKKVIIQWIHLDMSKGPTDVNFIKMGSLSQKF